MFGCLENRRKLIGKDFDCQMMQEEGSNGEQDEEVSIEKDGEYLRIYMKCPCFKASETL